MAHTTPYPSHHVSQDERAPVQWFVGIDWGTQHHQVCVLDHTRQCVGTRTVEHSGTGLAQLATWLTALASGTPACVAVAIEVPRGPVVETLVERGFPVFTLNPKQLDRFRDRHTVAGAKDDRRDAFVLADSLCTDMSSFRPVCLDEPQVLVLRELSRAEEALGEEFRRAANRLREQWYRFYPQMLHLCPAADEVWLWALWELVPTPAHAASVTEEEVQRVLHIHRIRRVSAADVLAVLRTPAVQVAPGAVEAACAHCALLVPCLRVLAEQLKRCASEVEALLTALAAPADPTTGPSDVAIVQSLPGVGRKITAWLCAEAAQALTERDYQRLRTHGGVAPVTRQSGKRTQVVMRYGCNPRLRNALFHLARNAVQCDATFKSIYAALKQKGQRRGRALRSIADRLLRVLVAMLRAQTLYDFSQVHSGIASQQEG
jgi:transposase